MKTSEDTDASPWTAPGGEEVRLKRDLLFSCKSYHKQMTSLG